MARGLTAGLLAEIIAGSLRPIVFFEAEFSSGTIYVWSGYGDLSWDSKTWSGVGHFMGISPMMDTGTVQAVGVSIALSGIPSSLTSLVYTEARQGKPGTVWLGALDSTGAVVSDPYLSFKGRLDVPTDEDNGDTAKITITYESRLVDLERPRERRFTPEDQAIDYASDKGFDFVAGLQDAQLVWGRS